MFQSRSTIRLFKVRQILSEPMLASIVHDIILSGSFVIKIEESTRMPYSHSMSCMSDQNDSVAKCELM